MLELRCPLGALADWPVATRSAANLENALMPGRVHLVRLMARERHRHAHRGRRHRSQRAPAPRFVLPTLKVVLRAVLLRLREIATGER